MASALETNQLLLETCTSLHFYRLAVLIIGVGFCYCSGNERGTCSYGSHPKVLPAHTCMVASWASLPLTPFNGSCFNNNSELGHTPPVHTMFLTDIDVSRPAPMARAKLNDGLQLRYSCSRSLFCREDKPLEAKPSGLSSTHFF